MEKNSKLRHWLTQDVQTLPLLGKQLKKKEYLPNYSQNHLICITQMNQEMKKDNQGICTSRNQLKWTHQITWCSSIRNQGNGSIPRT